MQGRGEYDPVPETGCYLSKNRHIDLHDYTPFKGAGVLIYTVIGREKYILVGKESVWLKEPKAKFNIHLKQDVKADDLEEAIKKLERKARYYTKKLGITIKYDSVVQNTNEDGSIILDHYKAKFNYVPKNFKLGLPKGKKEEEKDGGNSWYTALREAREELGVILEDKIESTIRGDKYNFFVIEIKPECMGFFLNYNNSYKGELHEVDFLPHTLINDNFRKFNPESKKVIKQFLKYVSTPTYKGTPEEIRNNLQLKFMDEISGKMGSTPNEVQNDTYAPRTLAPELHPYEIIIPATELENRFRSIVPSERIRMNQSNSVSYDPRLNRTIFLNTDRPIIPYNPSRLFQSYATGFPGKYVYFTPMYPSLGPYNTYGPGGRSFTVPAPLYTISTYDYRSPVYGIGEQMVFHNNPEARGAGGVLVPQEGPDHRVHYGTLQLRPRADTVDALPTRGARSAGPRTGPTGRGPTKFGTK